MDQSEQKQQPVVGVVAGGGQMTYAPSSYQTAPMVVSGTPAIPVPSSTQPLANFSSSPHQLAYQQAQHFHRQQQLQQQHKLQMFWTNQLQEMSKQMISKTTTYHLLRSRKL